MEVIKNIMHMGKMHVILHVKIFQEKIIFMKLKAIMIILVINLLIIAQFHQIVDFIT